MNDEECVILAQRIRAILTFLVREIEGAKECKKQYIKAMGKLATKK